MDPRDELIKTLQQQITEQQAQITEQQTQITELRSLVDQLQSRLNGNSKNSSRPPSSDGLRGNRCRKNTSDRKRAPGGQPGHPGQSLEFSTQPDEIQNLKLERCPHCRTSLETEVVLGTVKRQQWEIPPIELVVTEWQAEQKWCECCGKAVTAVFPETINAPVQYGPNLRAFGVYLHYGQLLPLRRVGEVLEELLGVGVNSATLLNHSATLDPTLDLHQDWIRMKLLESTLLHNDETGLHLEGKLHWLHVNCNEFYTLYTPHAKRGQEGIRASEILDYYEGILIHDHWASYNAMGDNHGFCGAHLLRELQSVMENEGALWARDLQRFLRQLKQEVDQSQSWGESRLPPALWEEYWQQYQTLLSQAQTYYHLKDPPVSGKRGSPAQWKGNNLLDRFVLHPREMILWAVDFQIPFDNNQAERDLRMMKLRQKISGSFQAENSLNRFAKIRSIIASLKKQKVKILPALKFLFQQPKPELLPCFL